MAKYNWEKFRKEIRKPQVYWTAEGDGRYTIRYTTANAVDFINTTFTIDGATTTASGGWAGTTVDMSGATLDEDVLERILHG